PLIATDRLTHTQTLTSETACLVSADPAGFAGGIKKVLGDPAYGAEIAEGAQRYADEHFSDEKYIRMVSDIYDAMWRKLDAKDETDRPAEKSATSDSAAIAAQ
ncbi:MAG: hypothetical protein AAFV19_24905, partial [Pseudomonadota bacterium]